MIITKAKKIHNDKLIKKHSDRKKFIVDLIKEIAEHWEMNIESNGIR